VAGREDLWADARQQADDQAAKSRSHLGPAPAWSSRVEALRAGLRDLGWIEGKNIVIEFRWADNVDQLPGLAAELVRMKVDVIFASSSTMVEPARGGLPTPPHYQSTASSQSTPPRANG
jgi:hypothetical protein